METSEKLGFLMFPWSKEIGQWHEIPDDFQNCSDPS